LRNVVTAVPARILNDAALVRQLGDRGFGETIGEVDVSDARADFVELGEAAEDDALVVGPCCLY
jgi:hypothetical protein